TFPGLVDDRFSRPGCELWDDFPTGLAANQHAAAGPWVANARLPGATVLQHARPPALVRGKVGQVQSMALARVNNVKPELAEAREQRRNRCDHGARQRDVVAEQIDVPALAAKVRLHVDDDERGVRGRELTVVGPGVGGGSDVFGHVSPLAGVSAPRRAEPA